MVKACLILLDGLYLDLVTGIQVFDLIDSRLSCPLSALICYYNFLQKLQYPIICSQISYYSNSLLFVLGG